MRINAVHFDETMSDKTYFEAKAEYLHRHLNSKNMASPKI